MKNMTKKRIIIAALVVISGFVTCSFATAADPHGAEKKAAQNVSPGSSQGSQGIEMLSHLGGFIQAVAQQNGLIYAGFGADLSVLNPSTPGSPQKIGSAILSGNIQDISLSGNLAFTANGTEGMSIADITVPAHPVELGSFDTPGDGYAIAPGNGYAYVADGSQGVRVINISNLSNPFEGNSISLPSPARDVIVYGNTLYVADELSGLYVYNISNPLIPNFITIVPSSDQARNLVVMDHYLLLGVNYRGLRILDLTNPTAPVEIGKVENIGYINDVSVTWPYAYASDWYNAVFYVIDISTLSSPQKVGQFQPAGIVHGLYGSAVINNQAFVTMGTRGIYTLNVSNPGNPTQLGIYNALGEVRGIALWGDTLYAANSDVVAIDITNPTSPMVMGSTMFDGDTHAVGAYNGYAYSDNSSAFPFTINIDNFTNPYEPIVVDTLEIHGAMREMQVVGNTGYLANDGVQILDLTNPALPVILGTYSSVEHAGGLAVQGNYIYLADGQNLRIIDASNKENPVSVGLIGVAYEVRGVFVDGNYAYAAWTNYNYVGGGFTIIDISIPENPQEISVVLTTWGAHGIAVDGNILYLGAGNQGVLMFNISDKDNPVQVGYYADSFGGDLLFRDGTIYLSSETGGLYMLAPIISSISGSVRGPNNAPIAGVTLQTEGGSVITDADGMYNIPGLAPGIYTITPTDPVGVYVPTHLDVTVPPNQTNQDFHKLPEPVSTTVSPGITTTLSYIDLQGLQTQITFPAGAVSETISATIQPILPTNVVGYSATGHSFNLLIDKDGSPMPVFTFNAPVDVSVQYSDFDVRGVFDESNLILWWMVNNVRNDSAESCSPSSVYTRDLAGNQIGIPVCQSGTFSLMGPTRTVFLPTLLRK